MGTPPLGLRISAPRALSVALFRRFMARSFSTATFVPLAPNQVFLGKSLVDGTLFAIKHVNRSVLRKKRMSSKSEMVGFASTGGASSLQGFAAAQESRVSTFASCGVRACLCGCVCRRH